MSEWETTKSEGVPPSVELSGRANLEVGGFVASGSATGDQSFAYAGIQIEVEEAAHRREIEKQRVKREIEKDEGAENEAVKDRHWQRVRDNCTYGVVVLLIILGLAGSFIVAVTSNDPSLKTWAQDLTTTIAGVVGGAFAGYLIGSKK